MKVLLFNPPTPDGKKFIREGRCTQEEGAWSTLWPPVSLATAAAVLERAGHTVSVRDFPAEGAGMANVDRFVQTLRPDLAIWSSATASINTDLAFARRLKELVPGIKTATFGTHAATLVEESFEAFPDLDFIIRGEPELTVLDLADALVRGTPLQEVPGLASKGAPEGSFWAPRGSCPKSWMTCRSGLAPPES